MYIYIYICIIHTPHTYTYACTFTACVYVCTRMSTRVWTCVLYVFV